MFGRLIGLVCLTALAVSAMAGPQTYAQRVQNIRAGIVILATARQTATAQPQSAGPYAFYNLDSNTSVKPAGWNFYNPYGPTVVTQAIYNRWSQIDPIGTEAVGGRLGKMNAAYWEVFLGQVSDTQLANYDMLLVNPYTYASLNPTEQLRLRRFVDNGGVLWIDPAGLASGGSGSAIDQFNNFPVPFSPTVSVGTTNQQTDFSNALTNAIQTLSPSDINTLEQPSPTQFVLNQVNFQADGLTNMQATELAQIAGGDVVDFFKLQTVSQLNGAAAISTGQIGDGLVVITARGASLKLNRASQNNGYLVNEGFTGSTPNLGADGVAAAKLAVNMVGMLDESRQQASGSRKNSSSAIDIDPPLLSRSTITDSTFSSYLTGIGTSTLTPCLYKGLLVTTIDGQVKVFDANPIVDLDGDGNPDDGMPDYGLGAPYDQIWQSVQLTPPLSAPVCAQVEGGSPGTATDEVLVVDGNGNLNIFNLIPRNANGTYAGSPPGTAPGTGFSPALTIGPPNGSATRDLSLTGVPIAPTVHEGIAYVTDTVSATNGDAGRVWQVDLLNGGYVQSTGPFVMGGNFITLPEFSYGATVGYIPIQDNSGGVDKVLYAPFAPGTSTGMTSAGFTSLWLGAKGEVPTSYDANGAVLQVMTRASQHGSPPIFTGSGNLGLGPKITLLDVNGNPMPDTQLIQIFNGSVTTPGNGQLDFGFANGVTSLPGTVSGVRVDYTIDWGDNGINTGLASAVRGSVELPDVLNAPARAINGGVALSPQGTIYVVNSTAGLSPTSLTPPPGGGLYGFREAGYGKFNMISRYELYGPNSFMINQTEQVNDTVGVLQDNDYLITYMAQVSPVIGSLLAQPMNLYEVRGGPSIRNGQVFVTASAMKGSSVPVTILMAFNAEPQTPTFAISNFPQNAVIEQPDFARSTNQNSPENESTVGLGTQTGGGYIYDAASGVISFPSLMSNQSGPVQNALSLSQPIIIHAAGSTDTYVYPDTLGGAVWNPLQWFVVEDGSYPSGGAPLVTGGSVFMSCDSYLPGLLTNGILQTKGVINGFNAQIPSSSLNPNLAKPWLNQLYTVDQTTYPGNVAGIVGDPNVTWPQASSVTSFSDYVIKLNQTVLGPTSTTTNAYAFGLVGGDGALVAWGSNGLYTFAKSNFLICDEGRIVMMDPSGNPVWTTNVTASPGQSAINASANVKQMVRPVRAYLLNPSTVLFADAGANRVAKVGTNGVEQRSITSFQLDPNFVAPGYATGESLSLSGPRDAVYYTSYANVQAVSTLVTVGDGETGTNTEFWQHYLIADTNNKRLIEVIDRFYYNPNSGLVGQPVTVAGVPQVGVLLWHSPAAVTGKQYTYNSINRILVPDNNGGHFVYVTGIGGSLPTAVGLGTTPYIASPPTPVDSNDGTGGIVIFDPTNQAGPVVFNEISTPNVSNTAFWDPNTNAFDNIINQNTALGMSEFVQRTGGAHRLTNVNSVTAKVVTNGNYSAGATPLISIMVADGTGVYEMTYTPGTQALSGVDWMITNEAFCAIQQSGNPAAPTSQNPQALRALFARRLDSGEVLIVNGYLGNTIITGTPFTGEVMQINGAVDGSVYNPTSTNLGFNSASISLDLRTAGSTNLRGLVMPVFADRR